MGDKKPSLHSIATIHKRTDLMIAASLGRVKEVQEILEKSPLSLNERTKNGETALIIAARNGHTEVVQYLVGIPGINLNILDAQGKTALDIAVMKDNYAIQKLLSRSQMVIIENLIAYLKIKARTNPKYYTQLDIDRLVKDIFKGQCNGLACYWIYRKIQNQGSLFNGTLRLIANWDKTESSLNDGDSFLNRIFEVFLNDVGWFQIQSNFLKTNLAQTEIAKLFEMINKPRLTGHKLKEEFSMDFHFKPNELNATLKMVLNPGKPVYFGGPNHAMAIMREDRDGSAIYKVYEPNLRKGEIVYEKTNISDSIEAIQKFIERRLFSTLGHSTNIMALSIRVIDEEERPSFDYPMDGVQLASAFLHENNDAIRETQGDIRRESAIHFLIYNNNAAMIRAFLNKKECDPNKRNWKGVPPLVEAVRSENNTILRMLAEDPRIVYEDYFAAIIEATKLKNSIMVSILEKARIVKSRILSLDPEYSAWERFMISIAANDVKAVSEMLQNQNLIHKQDSLGRTPLMLAISTGSLEMVEQILAHKPSLLVQDHGGATALACAIEVGNLAIFKAVLQAQLNEKGDPNVVNNNGETPLLEAVKGSRFEMVKLMNEDLRFNFNIKNKQGNSLLCIAIENEDIELVSFLVDHSTLDVNSSNEMGHTALMIAVLQGSEMIVKKLLQKRDIDIEITDQQGYSAYHWAVQYGDLEIVKLFLDKVLCEKGEYSKENYWEDILLAEAHGQKHIVDYLAKQKNSEFDLGSKPVQLHLAAVRGDVDTVRNILSDSTMNPNFQDAGGIPALINAQVNHRLEVVVTLLSHPAVNVDAQTREGDTALMLAIEDQNIEVIKMLLKAGASVDDLRNDNEMSALDIANSIGNVQIINLLNESQIKHETTKESSESPSILHAQERYNDSTSKQNREENLVRSPPRKS